MLDCSYRKDSLYSLPEDNDSKLSNSYTKDYKHYCCNCLFHIKYTISIDIIRVWEIEYIRIMMSIR
jgi:hypothetical protein